MAKVVADISMSLDGFVTGPDAGPGNGLGMGGEALHSWVFEGDSTDEEIVREATESSGAVVMGRRLFDIVDAPDGWTDEMGYGAAHAASPPFFVVTHEAPDKVRLTLDFTFVSDGVASAIDKARAAAGSKNVSVMGGGNVIARCVEEGLLDELRIHLAPVVLGAGTRLFENVARRELEQRSVVATSSATHLTYGLVR